LLDVYIYSKPCLLLVRGRYEKSIFIRKFAGLLSGSILFLFHRLSFFPSTFLRPSETLKITVLKEEKKFTVLTKHSMRCLCNA